MLFFFFFKHKTAYELRISDWSSDVCSSDLMIALRGPRGERPAVESDVVAKCVGPGADRVGGAGRGGVAVDADVAKVLTECRLHAGANRRTEESRVGTECVSTVSYRGSPNP